jgi:hypothetical protein
MIGKKQSSLAVLGALVLLCVTVALPSRQRAGFSEVSRMQVEVDVYSGRPNPRWDLSRQQTEEFLKKLRALPKREGDGALKDGLGYRGLKVKSRQSSREGDTEIVISNGIVAARDESKSQQFTDQNRALERWLLQTGKGKLDDELYEYLREETLK